MTEFWSLPWNQNFLTKYTTQLSNATVISFAILIRFMIWVFFLLILEREITFQMPFTLYRAAGCYGQYSATAYK